MLAFTGMARNRANFPTYHQRVFISELSGRCCWNVKWLREQQVCDVLISPPEVLLFVGLSVTEDPPVPTFD
jgi:hypothetical protein